jgi:DNA repair protein RecO (recombination protein O)
MIVTTEAIVLRTRKYGDTSAIATLYTEAFGKMGVLAKGDRERGAKGVGALDVLSVITVVLYRKEHRELQLLSRVEQRRALRRTGENMDFMAAGMVLLELTEMTSPIEERNPALYALLFDSLSALEAAERNLASLVFFFEMHLLDILGFRPSWSACVRCGGMCEAVGEHRSFFFDPVAGGIVCADCGLERPAPMTLQSGGLKMLQRLLATTRPADSLGLSASAEVQREVGGALSALLANHAAGFKPPKSRAVFASLAGPESVTAA